MLRLGIATGVLRDRIEAYLHASQDSRYECEEQYLLGTVLYLLEVVLKKIGVPNRAYKLRDKPFPAKS